MFSMDLTCNFQPRQIVFLEHVGTRLYAEVIQVVVSRRLCWVRPLLLVVFPNDSQLSDEPLPLTDMRSSPDLLWPVVLFRPALDTEVIPLLTALLPLETCSELTCAAQQQLNQFIHQVWQAHPGAF